MRDATYRCAEGTEPALRSLGRGLAASQPGPLALTDLREALDAASIRPLYQPIVRVRDAVPVAVEVLARLLHPVRGVVAPDLFVPQVEGAGLALLLTKAVTQVAFADWDAGRLEALDIALALNFPLDVLLTPAALTWLDEARDAVGIPTRRIVVELTESRPVTAPAELAQAVTRLRMQGYGVAIDDIGPAMPRHADLLTLGFSSVKLDKSVVRKAMVAGEAEDFLVRTVAAAHAAGMGVVAEGVASRAMWQRMAEFSVDQAQGFLVARPMSATSVMLWHPRWLERAARTLAP